MRNFLGIVLYEHEHMGKFSNLLYCTFDFFFGSDKLFMAETLNSL